MLDKIQWKQEWRLSPREKKNYYGQMLYRDRVVELTDDNKKITIILPEEKLNFESDADFYGFANRSILTSAYVIPNELLQFEVCSYWAREIETKVTIQKISSREYSIEIFSEKYVGRGIHHSGKDVKEVLSKEELTKKLEHIKKVFEPYPFLALPLGNCFDES